MKILYVSTSCGVGGASVQIRRTCEYMISQGNQVILMSLLPPFSDEMVRSLEILGVRYVNLNMKRGSARLSDLIRFIKYTNSEKPDVIHSHMVHANFLVRIASPFLRCKNIINTIHGEEEFLGIRKYVYRITDSMAKYTVCVGDVLAQEAISRHIVSMKRVNVIYNGLDLAKYHRDFDIRKKMRNEYGVEDSFVWITVGRFESVKNHIYMINEFSKVTKYFPSSKLFMIGYGTEEGRIQNLIEKKGLQEKIVLTGKRNNVNDYLNMADAFVLSSIHEGLPLSLQEAGAVGLPLVSTNVGGCREIVVESQTGYLCESNKEGELSSCMLRLMNLKEKERIAFGNRAKMLVRDKFDISNIMEEWMALYL